MMIQETRRGDSFRGYRELSAHVPPPPEHDPATPPETPPPIGPEHEEVDLPPREAPDEIREPGKPPPTER